MNAPSTPPVILIAAMSRDRVIGTGDDMPWDVPEEYEQFRELTRDQTIVIGRKSFEIFGPDLTSRHTLVVTRGDPINEEGVVSCGSLDDALTRAAGLHRDVYVAGGASIYEQALRRADEMKLSVIKGEFAGDAYFPAFDASEWQIVEQRDHPQFTFTHYRRGKL